VARNTITSRTFVAANAGFARAKRNGKRRCDWQPFAVGVLFVSLKVCDCTPASGAVKPAPNNLSESFFDAPIGGANSPEISGAGESFRGKKKISIDNFRNVEKLFDVSITNDRA
jgi:hypothetical protein